jgi:hypothetical protein
VAPTVLPPIGDVVSTIANIPVIRLPTVSARKLCITRMLLLTPSLQAATGDQVAALLPKAERLLETGVLPDPPVGRRQG